MKFTYYCSNLHHGEIFCYIYIIPIYIFIYISMLFSIFPQNKIVFSRFHWYGIYIYTDIRIIIQLVLSRYTNIYICIVLYIYRNILIYWYIYICIQLLLLSIIPREFSKIGHIIPDPPTQGTSRPSSQRSGSCKRTARKGFGVDRTIGKPWENQ